MKITNSTCKPREKVLNIKTSYACFDCPAQEESGDSFIQIDPESSDNKIDRFK